MLQKELLHFGIHIYLQSQYSIPFLFPHCEKVALFYNLNFTKMYVNLENYVFISWTLCQISLFEFIRGEGREIHETF
jgi:hypothetical protein